MRYTELNEMPFGAGHGFPGYGQGIFRSGHYHGTAHAIARVTDPAVKEFLTDWFADLFKHDNDRFQPSYFKEVATGTKGGRESEAPFQQRHYWYLAHEIRKVADAHAREFLAHWIAGYAGSTNPNFRRKLWDKACGVESEAPDDYLYSPHYRGGQRRNTIGHWQADRLGQPRPTYEPDEPSDDL